MIRFLSLVLILASVLMIPSISDTSAQLDIPELEFNEIAIWDISLVTISDVAWSFDDRYMAIKVSGGLYIVDTRTWETVVSLSDCQFRDSQIDWSPNDYTLLVGCGLDVPAMPVNVDHPEIEMIYVDAYFGAVRWSTDGNQIAFQRSDGAIYILNANLDVVAIMGEPFETDDPLGPTHAVAFKHFEWSPNGQYMASIAIGQFIGLEVWNINTLSIVGESVFIDTENIIWSADGNSFTLTVHEIDTRKGMLQTWTVNPLEMVSSIDIPYRNSFPETSKSIRWPVDKSYSFYCEEGSSLVVRDIISGQEMVIDIPEENSILCPIRDVWLSGENMVIIESLSPDVRAYRIRVWNVYETYPSDTIISGQVWQDVNGDGLQTDESGGNVNGITVHLRDVNNNIVDTAVTNLNGIYRFVINPNTDYFIEAVLPSNLSFTTQQVGDDDTIDSDVNVATGRIEGINLAVGGRLRTLDIGVVENP